MAEEQEKWASLVERWESSGLSGAEWCRQQQLQYHIFMNWKRKLLQQKIPPLVSSKDEFTELIDPPTLLDRVKLECNGVLIHLDSNFNEVLLMRCLNLLKGLEC